MTIAANPAQSLWGQLGSFSFFAAGIVSDLLLVRLFLLLGYTWFILNAIVGFPSWPALYAETSTYSFDSIVWNLLGFYVHMSGFVRLLLDERPVEMSEEEAALWRMFYRHSGISRMLFKSQVLALGRFDDFAPGTVITCDTSPTVSSSANDHRQVGQNGQPVAPTSLNANTVTPASAQDEVRTGPEPRNDRRLYIIMEGHVRAATIIYGEERILRMSSGDMFEFKYLNLFGVHIGFLDAKMRATATSHVRTFSIPVRSLEAMAAGSGTMRQAWYSIIIAAISREAERPDLYYASSNEEADALDAAPSSLLGRASIFDPLADDELPPSDLPGSGEFFKHPLTNFAKLLCQSISLPWPFSKSFPGLRHAAAPPPEGKRAADIVRSQLERMPVESSSSSTTGASSTNPWTRFEITEA
ncbi:Hypothetical Protein FCC1311_020522 [Hondaea fermentalgiana]|uniref:Uncharacterized protein n=1 Tax=Hondaea fermentalgiana TaxID=2315210 RepID=A0A2R5GBA4_9STRA|nr:Hypothetical Protein FCC1311_020522 [Hondaea fermentalgiana]|eukprot:GBG25833.1 Hypothetical Protein FCC1311_020522 [Hondaea fermentalgiana]